MFLVIFHFFSFISASDSLSLLNSLQGELYGSICRPLKSSASLGLCADRFSRMEESVTNGVMELHSSAPVPVFSGWRRNEKCMSGEERDRERGEKGKI